jgi:hypothetical protein
VLANGVEDRAIAEDHLELDDRRLGPLRRSKGFACSCRSVQGTGTSSTTRTSSRASREQ